MSFQTLDAVFEILDVDEKGDLDCSVYMMSYIAVYWFSDTRRCI